MTRCLWYPIPLLLARAEGREAVVPLANNLIILERLIWLLRHNKCQNPSIISYSIDSARCGKKSRTEWNVTAERNGGVQCIVLEF